MLHVALLLLLLLLLPPDSRRIAHTSVYGHVSAGDHFT
jgi:hypothetical protein